MSNLSFTKTKTEIIFKKPNFKSQAFYIIITIVIKLIFKNQVLIIILF